MRMSWAADLHLALTFLTRLPLPDPGVAESGRLALAMRTFPLVGALVGGLAGGVHAAALQVLPPLAAALLALLAGLLLTGALHEDGLADLADGLGARGGRDARLAAMRDSRIGAYGVLALIFSIGLRAAALTALTGPGDGVLALVAAHALSRAAMPVLMQLLPSARSDGLAALAGVPHAGTAATAAGLALALGLALLGGSVLGAALLAALVAGAAVGWAARRAIGGYTGDVLGATEQAVQTAVLLTAAAWS